MAICIYHYPSFLIPIVVVVADFDVAFFSAPVAVGCDKIAPIVAAVVVASWLVDPIVVVPKLVEDERAVDVMNNKRCESFLPPRESLE